MKSLLLIFSLFITFFSYSQKDDGIVLTITIDSSFNHGYTTYRITEIREKDGVKHGDYKIYSYNSLNPEKKDSIIRKYHKGRLIQFNTYYVSSNNTESHYRGKDEKVKSVERFDVDGNLIYRKKMGLFKRGKEFLYHPNGELAQKTKLKWKTERVGCALVEKDILTQSKIVRYDESGKKIKKGKSSKAHLI